VLAVALHLKDAFDPLGDVPWLAILVPLVSAAFGGSIGAIVTRQLKREELYLAAAEKINGYVDEAMEHLNSLDREEPFNAEVVLQAKRAIGLARFHSLRLECDEITNRLAVTDFALWDLLEDEDYSVAYWVYQSIDDVMAAVVEFMKLPRWRPWSPSRPMPPNRFPNSGKAYSALVTFDHETDKKNYSKLREWERERMRELNER
jgi:hypothetical protein